jgi:hypothetical protein
LEVVAQAEVTGPPAKTTDTATGTSDPKADSTNPPKETTPVAPATPATGNVIKLDSGDGTSNGGTAGSATSGSDATSGVQSPPPAVVRPTSVMPNPIRSKSAQPSTGSAAAAN